MDGLDQLANRNQAEQEKGYEKAVVGALSEDLDHIAMAMTEANTPQMPNAVPIITPIAGPTPSGPSHSARSR